MTNNTQTNGHEELKPIETSSLYVKYSSHFIQFPEPKHQDHWHHSKLRSRVTHYQYSFRRHYQFSKLTRGQKTLLLAWKKCIRNRQNYRLGEDKHILA